MSKRVLKKSSQPQRQLLEVIQRCVDDNTADVFAVGVSGGSLPAVLAKVLPQVSTDWNKWRIFFCDERLVPFTDPESTFGAYRSLIPQLSDSQFVAIDPSLDPEDAATDYTAKIVRVLSLTTTADHLWPRFDLLLLGMGADGHTCSLFPNHALLEESSRWVAAITDSPKPPPNRVTLTLPVLNNAKCCVFYSTGAAKAQVLKEILVDGRALPAGLVLPSDGCVYWLLDTDSSRLIPNEMFE